MIPSAMILRRVGIFSIRENKGGFELIGKIAHHHSRMEKLFFSDLHAL